MNGAPKNFLENERELNWEDIGPIDGVWVFLPRKLLRDAINGGRQGMFVLDEMLRHKMKYGGATMVMVAAPLAQWTATQGWPPAGFLVAVAADGRSIYIQPQDAAPDSSTHIAEA